MTRLANESQAPKMINVQKPRRHRHRCDEYSSEEYDLRSSLFWIASVHNFFYLIQSYTVQVDSRGDNLLSSNGKDVTSNELAKCERSHAEL